MSAPALRFRSDVARPQTVLHDNSEHKGEDATSAPWVRKEFNEVFQHIPSKAYQIQAGEYLSNGKYPVVDQGKTAIVGYTNNADKVCNASKNPVIVFGDHTREVKYVDFDFVVGADGTQLLRSPSHDLAFLAAMISNIPLPNMGYSRHFKFLQEALFISPPSLPEQHKIGSFFRSLDALIAEREAVLGKMESLKKAMLEKMFPQGDAKIPEVRFKGFEDEWKVKRLGGIGFPYNGLSGKCKSDFGHGLGRYVTYMNVFTNPIADHDQCDAIEIDNGQNEVKDGDVFFTTSSETPEEVGMSSVWIGGGKNTYLNSFCFGYRPKPGNVSEFLAYMFRSNGFRNAISFLAQGISRYNISKTKVMDIEVLLPKFEEQQKIGAYFRSLDALLAARRDEVVKLKQLKKAFLERMFV